MILGIKAADSSLSPMRTLCEKFFRGSSKAFNTEYTYTQNREKL